MRVLVEGTEVKVAGLWMLEQFIGTSEGTPHTVVDLRNTPCQPNKVPVNLLGGRLWAEIATVSPPRVETPDPGVGVTPTAVAEA